MKRALKDIVYGTNTFEFETLLMLPMKDRIVAGIGQACLYLIFIFLFHLAFIPYYNDTESSKKVTLLIYTLIFVGLQGPSIITIIKPSLFKYKKILKYSSIIITALGSGLLGAEVVLSINPDSYSPLYDYMFLGFITKENLIFSSTPTAESFYTLGVAYLLFLFGMKFSLETIYNTNEKKVEVETEIIAARKIQESINSPININNQEFECTGKVTPAKEVGGDYMEFLPLSNSNYALAIGDVSGHDTASGLLMGMTKASFDTIIEYQKDLKVQIESLNKLVGRFSDKDKFVTFQIASFDFMSRTMETVNAGHLPLFHYKAQDNTFEELKPEGMILGVINDAKYQSLKTNFFSGDIFVGITDGLIETRNQSDEEFGSDRLMEIIQENQDQPAETIFNAIHKQLQSFSSNTSLADDISLFILKVK